MSIWGKVIGGVAGFAVGGPLGALIGAIAGHAVDQMQRGGAARPADDIAAREVAFTVAVIVLAAKMAKADGRVTRTEVEAFKRIFHVPPGEMEGVGELFDKARADAQGFEPYAEQIAGMFAHEPAVLEELLGGLFHIAGADGAIHPAELDFLHRVGAIFGLEANAFERIRASAAGAGDADPYQVLDVPRGASAAEIKKAYRRLSRENHPDTLIAKGMPKEFIDLANEKMATINAAYDRVRKARGLA